MKRSIIINFSNESADLLEALQKSIEVVLYDAGCNISINEEHNDTNFLTVEVANLSED